MLAETTVTIPPITTAAAAIVVVLSALALIWRYLLKPMLKGGRFVKELLDTFAAVVDQVRDLVSYVALFVIDVEARLDRIESALELGPYQRRAGDPAPPQLREALAERARTVQAIRDLGGDE